MKVKALSNHKCYCCGKTIEKGEECIIYFVPSSDPSQREFDTIYTCLKCAEEESCRVRIERKVSSA